MTEPGPETARRLTKDPLAHLIANYFTDALVRRTGQPVADPAWLAETSFGLADAVRLAAGARPVNQHNAELRDGGQR